MKFYHRLPLPSLIICDRFCFRPAFLINFSPAIFPLGFVLLNLLTNLFVLYDFTCMTGALPEKEGQNGGYVSSTLATSQVL